jgi:hypothetical protein
MKLTAKSDIEAPLAYLYASISDTVAWEREAVRRGVEIERPGDMPLAGVGAGWLVKVPFRGRLRKFQLRIDSMVPDESLEFSLDGQAMTGAGQLDTKSLSARRSRLRVTVEVKPKTLAARLFLNTLRLARRQVEARFEKRLGQFAARIEDRYARDKAR